MTNTQKERMDRWADTMANDEQAARHWRKLFDSDPVMRRTNLDHIVQTMQVLAQTERIEGTVDAMMTQKDNQAGYDREIVRKPSPAPTRRATRDQPPQKGNGQGWDL